MPTPKSKKQKIIVFTLIIAVIAALGTVAAVRKREVVIEVQTQKVARRDITEIVVANGRIQPVVAVMINPEVSGEITALPVKEGQPVKKGDLLVKIKPDNYIAGRNSAEAQHKSALANMALAKANMDKAEVEYKRFERLFNDKLVSDSDFLSAKTSFEVAKASHETATHGAAQAHASLARAEDDLAKTTIVSPIDGTVTKLKSQAGERVVGTAMMAGTEIMTIANLNDMEARVDIGESDVVLIAIGQKARLEVEAFRDRRFDGEVTEIANASKNLLGMAGGGGGGQNNQEATKFEVKIRVLDQKVAFRPGMTVTAEIQTRSVTNVLSVPIQSVTTRVSEEERQKATEDAEKANEAKTPEARAKKEQERKVQEIVFLMDGERAKKANVTSGISNDDFIEITEGLQEGQEVISGGYRAISRELDDGKKVKREDPNAKKDKKKK